MMMGYISVHGAWQWLCDIFINSIWFSVQCICLFVDILIKSTAIRVFIFPLAANGGKTMQNQLNRKSTVFNRKSERLVWMGCWSSRPIMEWKTMKMCIVCQWMTEFTWNVICLVYLVCVYASDFRIIIQCFSYILLSAHWRGCIWKQ